MKVLVIGLDGVTFDLLGPWIESGELPNLRRLVEQGASGTLRSTLPPISSSSWSSFATGVNPGKHGLVDFVFPGVDSYKVSMINAMSRRTLAVWNWLNDAGLKVGLLGIPTTYPTEAVDGFMISGFLSPGPESEWAHPPALKSELRAELGEFQLAPNERYRSTRRLDLFLKDLTASVENRTQAALHLMRTKPWDFFTVVYWDTDMVQHETWRLLDPSHPRHDPAEAAAHREEILAFHRKVDSDVGRLLAEIDSDTLVMIMSDHGFGSVHSFFLTNNWLASLGMLQFKRNPWTAFKRFIFRLGFTPLRMFRVVQALGLGRLRKKVRFQQKSGLVNRVFLSFDDVDWSRTKAFSIGSFGQVYINLEGARPEGIVKAGRECEELVDLLESEALRLRDPTTGDTLVDRVYRRAEVYSGPYIDRTPDLVVQPRGWEYMAFGHADFGSNKLVEPIIGLSGHHRLEGIVIIAGPGVKAGTRLEGASILDLAPTILHAMGVPVPRELDGQVLSEAFEESSPVAQPAELIDTNIYKDGDQAPQFSDDEMDEVQDKLRGWGYAG
jgi:predicted AlkP superfamily phosphohydrolase/phosphomutase